MEFDALLRGAAQQIDELDLAISHLNEDKKAVYQNVKETVPPAEFRAWKEAVKLRQKRRTDRDKMDAHDSLVADMLHMLEQDGTPVATRVQARVRNKPASLHEVYAVYSIAAKRMQLGMGEGVTALHAALEWGGPETSCALFFDSHLNTQKQSAIILADAKEALKRWRIDDQWFHCNDESLEALETIRRTPAASCLSGAGQEGGALDHLAPPSEFNEPGDVRQLGPGEAGGVASPPAAPVQHSGDLADFLDRRRRREESDIEFPILGEAATW
jgi:uncharacterized protein (UPF0335 family)